MAFDVYRTKPDDDGSNALHHVEDDLGFSPRQETVRRNQGHADLLLDEGQRRVKSWAADR